jgi:hypothetical protein
MHDRRTPVQVPTPATLRIWPLNPDGSCGCGRNGCSDAGKHPRMIGPVDEGEGYGIYCGESGPKGSGVFVVDCDVKPGVNGLENFHALCIANGGLDIPDTLIVATGGGGLHFYFLAPGFPVKNSVGSTSKGLCKGVDIRGEGGWVVGPGSPHRSGRPYAVVRDVPIAQAPDWLLTWPGLRKTTQGLAEGPVGDFAPIPITPEHPDWSRRVESFRAECRGELGSIRPSIMGQGGSGACYHAAKRGTCYYVLPRDMVLAILMEDYNPRCEPPWDEWELAHKVDDAISTNDEPTPGPPPQDWGQRLIRIAMAGGAGTALDPTTGDLKLIEPRRDGDHPADCTCGGGDGGRHTYRVAIGESVVNGDVRKALETEVLFKLTRHPDWVGVLQWDEFSDCVRAVYPPIKLDAEDGPLTKVDLIGIQVWFQCEADIRVDLDTLRGCVEAAAKQLRVHPVRDYLRSLPMGRANILDNLAAEWFGATDPLDQHMLKLFLVGAVRRILWPGTQMDTMLILYGRLQGEGKSQWIKTMFGSAWMNFQMPALDSKDASHQMATCWAQEIGELDALLRVRATTAKDFISRPFDTYRKPYGMDVIRKERQNVLIGTTNIRECLRDPTGERRYWPIEVLLDIDQGKVSAMRDEVWAAAVALAYDQEFKHWIPRGSDMDILLKLRHDYYTDADPWQGAVEDYCAGRPFVTGEQVYQHVIMRGDPDYLKTWKRSEQNAIADIMRAMGCMKDTRTIGGRATKVYLLPPSIAKATPSATEQARRIRMKEPTLVLIEGGKK